MDLEKFKKRLPSYVILAALITGTVALFLSSAVTTEEKYKVRTEILDRMDSEGPFIRLGWVMRETNSSALDLWITRITRKKAYYILYPDRDLYRENRKGYYQKKFVSLCLENGGDYWNFSADRCEFKN